MCALIQTTSLLPTVLNLFHETAAPGIAVPEGGIWQAAGQFSVAGPVPWLLMFMIALDPELVRVAEPLTVQSEPAGTKAPPDAVSVTVLAVAVKWMLPVCVVVPLLHTTMKL